MAKAITSLYFGLDRRIRKGRARNEVRVKTIPLDCF